MIIKADQEEIDTEGVFKSLAKGIWGLMGGQETPTPKPKPEDDKYSKLDIHKVKLTT